MTFLPRSIASSSRLFPSSSVSLVGLRLLPMLPPEPPSRPTPPEPPDPPDPPPQIRFSSSETPSQLLPFTFSFSFVSGKSESQSQTQSHFHALFLVIPHNLQETEALLHRFMPSTMTPANPPNPPCLTLPSTRTPASTPHFFLPSTFIPASTPHLVLPSTMTPASTQHLFLPSTMTPADPTNLERPSMEKFSTYGANNNKPLLCRTVIAGKRPSRYKELIMKMVSFPAMSSSTPTLDPPTHNRRSWTTTASRTSTRKLGFHLVGLFINFGPSLKFWPNTKNSGFKSETTRPRFRASKQLPNLVEDWKKSQVDSYPTW